MSLYLTIDGGTSNTRIHLVKDKKIIDSTELNIGARANIGNIELLKKIKKAIDTK